MSTTLEQLLALPLAERNQTFHALTKEERCVLVAQDVLLRIRTKEYTPISNTYIDIDAADAETKILPKSGQESLQAAVEEGVKCHVCAIGASFMSTVRLGNNATIASLDAPNRELVETASAALTTNELRAMELVVEKSALLSDFTLDTVMALVRYRKKLIGRFDGSNTQTATMIIKALMKNVIKNGGSFRVPGYDVDFDEDVERGEKDDRLRWMTSAELYK